jgi:peptide/nickel transport system permease protein
MKRIRKAASDLLQYPSAVIGLVIIVILVIAAIVTLIALPYKEAIRLWRGGEDVWYNLPKNVPPAWTNIFRREKLPNTIILNSAEGDTTETTETTSSGNQKRILTYTFDYNYDTFPKALTLFMTGTYQEKPPFASLSWETPDGRTIRLTDLAVKGKTSYRFDQDEKLKRRLGGVPPNEGLFIDPNGDPDKPVKGTYKLIMDTVNFEPGSDVEGEFVMYGGVYGLAGTDHLRRDLMVALLWGIPVALAFGLLAALGTTVLTMLIAAVGVWYNGWVDDLIQRITEVNLVLPFLPILIMVATFYSRSIWLMLGVTILLSIFGGAIKFYRATFMQIKEGGYIEAARAYGASDIRMIWSYLLPRIVPMLIPQLVVLIPTYVFLEASLAVLGLGDPVLPTWGKVIQDAQSNGALYQGLYYWVLEPAVLLMITGLAFALLGFALDRIFNPRLREI